MCALALHATRSYKLHHPSVIPSPYCYYVCVYTHKEPFSQRLGSGCLRPCDQIACTKRINNDVLRPTTIPPLFFHPLWSLPTIHMPLDYTTTIPTAHCLLVVLYLSLSISNKDMYIHIVHICVYFARMLVLGGHLGPKILTRTKIYSLVKQFTFYLSQRTPSTQNPIPHSFFHSCFISYTHLTVKRNSITT